MVRHLLSPRRLQVTFFVAFCGVVIAGAQTQLDYSGTYTEKTSGKQVSGGTPTLTISQTNQEIQIRRQSNGASQLGTFPLDGKPGVFTTESGLKGQGSAHWKGSTLLIETLVASLPQAGKIIRFHTKEQWQLSKDRQTLKVHIETDSPDMPREITAAAIEPYTEVYQRSPSNP